MSVIIVLLLVGVPHYYRLIGKIDQLENSLDYQGTSVRQQKEKKYTGQTDLSANKLLGRWELHHEDEDFRGTLLYHLKKRGDTIKGYNTKITDEAGHTIYTNVLVFTLKSFKNNQGHGLYHIEHQGKPYTLQCHLRWINEAKLKVQYDYYGQKINEIWNKIK